MLRATTKTLPFEEKSDEQKFYLQTSYSEGHFHWSLILDFELLYSIGNEFHFMWWLRTINYFRSYIFQWLWFFQWTIFRWLHFSWCGGCIAAICICRANIITRCVHHCITLWCKYILCTGLQMRFIRDNVIMLCVRTFTFCSRTFGNEIGSHPNRLILKFPWTTRDLEIEKISFAHILFVHLFVCLSVY